MAGPWEKYQKPASDGPWAKYAKPKHSIMENVWGKGEIDTPGERLGATINDMGKSLLSGTGKGVMNILTLPQTAGGLLDIGMEKAFGIKPAPSILPNSGQMAQTAYDKTLGYDPRTTAGEYANTVGEFIPGTLMGGTLPQMVASGLTSEFAGQMTEDTPYEPYARLAGAILGPTVANVGGKVVQKAVSPNAPAPPTKLQAAANLADEGVSTTAGQKVGNKKLQYNEEQLGRTLGVMEDQADDFTRAVMKRIDVDGLATPENMKAATRRIGGVFDDIARGRDVTLTPQQIAAADDAVRMYSESVGSVAALPGNIANKLRSGTITGAEYNDFASRLGKAMTSNDSALRDAAIQLRTVLDDALQASVPQADAARLAVARAQYRDLLAIERAVSMAGETAATGVVTPARLRSAVAQQGRRSYVQGGRDLGELSRSGVIGMSRLPNSGTAQRLGAQIARTMGPMAGSGSIGAGVGGMLGGPPGAAIGAGLGILAPMMRNTAMGSALGQRYLANQLMQRAPATGGNPLVPGILGMANQR